jgi:hypothetical protein
MQVKTGELPSSEAFRKYAGQQINEAKLAMKHLASTYGNHNSGGGKNNPSARRVSTGTTPPITQPPYEFRLPTPDTTSEDSEDGYVARSRKKKRRIIRHKTTPPTPLSVESTDADSDVSYCAKKKKKPVSRPKKAAPTPFLMEDTENEVVDVTPQKFLDEDTDVDSQLETKSAKKSKQARPDGRKNAAKPVRKRKKEVTRVKKQEPAPADTHVTPLKLTCEIELGPATLAAIAEHVEALFLKKMMGRVEPEQIN